MRKNLNFEEAMSSLDDIVKKLETGSMTLEDSLSAFEEAIKLVKICNQKLDLAEQKVRVLTENIDGSVTDVALENLTNET